MPFHRRPRPTLAATALLAASGVLGLSACGQATTTASGPATASAAGSATGSARASGIEVKATDDACTLSATTAPVGTVTFQVRNAGSKVNEFYVYGPGDRILGEVEDVSPGLSRELKVEVTEAGTITTACKPAMTGDGIRAPFTITK